MKWGCKLKGVVVFAIPVTILPISKMHGFSRPDFAIGFADRFGSYFGRLGGDWIMQCKRFRNSWVWWTPQQAGRLLNYDVLVGYMLCE